MDELFLYSILILTFLDFKMLGRAILKTSAVTGTFQGVQTRTVSLVVPAHEASFLHSLSGLETQLPM